MERLNNEFVSVCYYKKTEYSKPYILVKDLKDEYNEQTSYTTLIRGIDKAWQFIAQIFNSYELKKDLHFSDINKILDEKFNLKTHYYCAMD